MAEPAQVVGMLDWGVGGLGCYRLLRAALPRASVIYLSDTGVTPYGKLPRAQLKQRVGDALSALVARGANRLLVACNAASTALPELSLPVPTLGVIEAALAAVPEHLTGVLGVLGGVRTIRSQRYQRALMRPGLTVLGRVAQPLSAHIEAGAADSARCREDLARIMKPLREVDALLLACTHYPAIAAAIAAHAPHARLIDPAEMLVERAKAQLGLSGGDGAATFLTTGATCQMQEAAACAWGLSLPHVTHVRLSRGRGRP